MLRMPEFNKSVYIVKLDHHHYCTSGLANEYLNTVCTKAGMGFGVRQVEMLQDGNGTVTAGNSSTYGDAAAAVVLMGGDVVKSRGISPIARVVAFAQAGVEPAYMGIAPVPAVTSVVSLTAYKTQILEFLCDVMLHVVARICFMTLWYW
jgi:hypothetical protein